MENENNLFKNEIKNDILKMTLIENGNDKKKSFNN